MLILYYIINLHKTISYYRLNVALSWHWRKNMIIRYDTYERYKKKIGLDDIPCIIYNKTEKTSFDKFNSANWHEDLEIQFFTEGEGYLLICGEKYTVKGNSVAVINSNLIHHTATDSNITYYPIIIDFKFCKNAGIDCSSLIFDTLINDNEIIELLKKIVELYYSDKSLYKKAKLQSAVLNLMINLAEFHTVSSNISLSADNSFKQLKTAVEFIRDHYSEKLTLDIIAKNSFIDKFALSKKFKMLTGCTVVEYINSFRCERIMELMHEGIPSSTAAVQCGFNNISFFIKTFKKYTGMLPSEYKKQKVNKK